MNKPSRVDIESIRIDARHLPKEPDVQAVGLQERFDEKALEYAQAEIEALRSNRTLREGYAKRIFWFLVCWCAVVFLLLLAEGSQEEHSDFWRKRLDARNQGEADTAGA